MGIKMVIGDFSRIREELVHVYFILEFKIWSEDSFCFGGVICRSN